MDTGRRVLLPPITVPLLPLDSQQCKAKGKISPHLLAASVCTIMNFPCLFSQGACQCPYQKKKNLLNNDSPQLPLGEPERGYIPTGMRQQFSQTHVCPAKKELVSQPLLVSFFVPVCLHYFQNKTLIYLVASNTQKHWWCLSNEMISNNSLISFSANTFVLRNNKLPGYLTISKTGGNYQHSKANSVFSTKICSHTGLPLE